MIRSLNTIIAMSLLAFSGINPACAEDTTIHPYQMGEISIADIYTSQTHQSARTGAVFMGILHNNGETRQIVEASSPVAERVEFHTMVMDGDVMQMREAEHGFVVTGHQDTNLHDIGAHFMLMGLKQPLVAGEVIQMTVTLDNQESHTFDVPVLSIAEAQNKNSMH